MLMQGRTIGTSSFREDDIEDDIDFRVALRSVLAITGWWDKEQFFHQIIGLHGCIDGLVAIIGRLFYHHTDILFVSFSKS